jgi:DNA polymerase IV
LRKYFGMKKMIEYLKLPDFWAQIEKKEDPTLNKKAFVVGTYFSESKTVLAVSSSARQEGIKKGMSLVQAKALAPKLEVVSPNFDLYENIFEKIRALLQKRYPVIEPEPSKGIFIDYSGLNKIYGAALDEGRSLQRELKSSFCLKSILGMSETKFVSRLAVEANSDTFLEVKRNEVKDFLAPWPVEVVPGIKECLGKNGIHDVCSDLNLRHISDLMKLPKEFLQVAFGMKRAELIYACVHGNDFRAVTPQEKSQSLSELVRFDEATNDYLIIMNKLYLAVNELEATLIDSKSFADSCGILFRYTDYSKKEKHFKLRSFSNLYKELKPSIEKVLRSRRLGVRDILIRLDGIEQCSTQLHLFEDVLKRQKLKTFLVRPENKFIKKIS